MAKVMILKAPDLTLPLFPTSISQHDAWDYILPTDPDAFDDVSYEGFLSREWPGLGFQNSYVYEMSFTDSAHTIELVMSSDYGSQANARVDVDKYTPRFGKLPKLYRDNMLYMLGYTGDGVFSSEDAGHFFKGYSERADLRIANDDLEETIFHEATHASIQKEGTSGAADGLGAGDYLASAEWAAAKAADNDAAVTEYALTSDQERFAEHALIAFTMIHYPERIPLPYRTAIANGIPNQIAFFESIPGFEPPDV